MKTTNTYEIKIFIAGDIPVIENVCRKYCLIGFCVSVTQTNFVFTGGSESGAIIGLMNYARFPKSNKELTKHAMDLAKLLVWECSQRSCSIVTPEKTYYIENDTIAIPR